MISFVSVSCRQLTFWEPLDGGRRQRNDIKANDFECEHWIWNVSLLLNTLSFNLFSFSKHLFIWWWTGRPGVLRFMGSQRVGHDWMTELNWTFICKFLNHFSTIKISDPHTRLCMWKILPHIVLNTEDPQDWGNGLFYLEFYKNFHGKIDFNPQILW